VDFKPAFFPDDVMAIMDATNTQSATFVCQSMGGWTGSQMALQHPERVDALLMSHTPGVFFHESAYNDPKKVAEQVSARPMTGFGSAALASDFPQKNPAGAVLYAQISSFNGIDPAAVPRQINAAQLGVNTESLTDYDIPTLFVTADHDILFPPEFISALAKTIPGADCVNLGDAGHSSYFEIPEAFNRVLRDFLSSTSD
jgi:pimeloyl-ACP methyl ester carboxylesterase